MFKPSQVRKCIKPMIILTNCSLLQATYLKERLQKSDNYYKIYVILKCLLLILIISTYLQILLIQEVANSSAVGSVVRQVSFGMIMTNYLCMFFHSLRKNFKYNELIDKFVEFDKLISFEIKDYDVTTKQIYYYIAFLLTCFVCIVCEKLFNGLYNSKYFHYPYVYYIVSCNALFSSSVNLLNFLVFVNMVQMRLKYINEKLRVYKRKNEFNNSLKLKILRDLCEFHMKLNDIALLVNDVFGISLLTTIALYFMHFISGSHTLIFVFKIPIATNEMYQLLITCMVYNYPYIVQFVWICYGCRHAAQEVLVIPLQYL